MIEEGLWAPNVKKPAQVHPRRERRASIGEMAQADASFHDWFEGRGPKCALHVAIDDATSALMQMHFKETESLAGYFEMFQGYFEAHGRPLNVYVDRHSIFRVNKKDPLSDGKEHITQFGRALKDLDINLIHAHSPQAKGRVERVNRTLQDRLIKEMRLAGISNIADANAFLPQFIKEHNARFAKPAANWVNLHRPLESYHNLEKILTPHAHRIIQNDLTLSYEGSLYQIMHKEEKHRLAKKSVVLWRDGQGKLHAELEERGLEILPLSEVIGGSSHQALQWKDKKCWKPGKDHPYKNCKSKAA